MTHTKEPALGMIPYRLKVAIREVIQAHAKHYRHGMTDLQSVMSALGEVSSELLAEIPGAKERADAFEIFIDGVFRAANQKAKNKAAIPEHRQ